MRWGTRGIDTIRMAPPRIERIVRDRGDEVA